MIALTVFGNICSILGCVLTIYIYINTNHKKK